MASHFDDFGVSDGNFSEVSSGPTCRPVAASITRSGTFLSCGHQEQPAVADRLDGRGLEHAVHPLHSRRPARVASKNGAGIVAGGNGDSGRPWRQLAAGGAAHERARRQATRPRGTRQGWSMLRRSLERLHLRSMRISVFPSVTSTAILRGAGVLMLASGRPPSRPTTR